jgi:hypothetical protein
MWSKQLSLHHSNCCERCLLQLPIVPPSAVIDCVVERSFAQEVLVLFCCRLVDGDVDICQSNAMIRYGAARYM